MEQFYVYQNFEFFYFDLILVGLPIYTSTCLRILSSCYKPTILMSEATRVIPFGCICLIQIEFSMQQCIKRLNICDNAVKIWCNYWESGRTLSSWTRFTLSCQEQFLSAAITLDGCHRVCVVCLPPKHFWLPFTRGRVESLWEIIM